MNCSKCIGKLSQKEIIKNIHVDVCFLCEGIWLDEGELESLIKQDSRDFLFDDLNSSDYDGREIIELAQELDEKEGQCPKCNVLLKRTNYRGRKGDLMIDKCPQCRGVWLDGGEIQQMRNRGVVDFIHRLRTLKLYWSFIGKIAKQDKENRKKDLGKKL